jgi:hypothetical protein
MFCAKVSFWAQPQVQGSGREAVLRAETFLNSLAEKLFAKASAK